MLYICELCGYEYNPENGDPENGIEPKSINIHSNHSTGKKEMLKYAKEHFKNTDITANPL